MRHIVSLSREDVEGIILSVCESNGLSPEGISFLSSDDGEFQGVEVVSAGPGLKVRCKPEPSGPSLREQMLASYYYQQGGQPSDNGGSE